MTGFARAHGTSGAYAWTWELKSVNAKGLDLRLRLPPGWDALEIPVRARAAEALSRGTVYATLTANRAGVPPVVRVNEPVLSAVLSTLRGLAGTGRGGAAEPRRYPGIEGRDRSHRRRRKRGGAPRGVEAAIVDGLSVRRLPALLDMRRHEGEALGQLLAARLAEIAALAARAEAAPGRRPEAIRARLAEQVATLLGASDRFDADRLHQEAILIAAKADVREELDRLSSHVAQAERLIGQGNAVGRRLDFLAQELHREANTLCAKASDVELTTIGLELKTVVEQFREQVQNLE